MRGKWNGARCRVNRHPQKSRHGGNEMGVEEREEDTEPWAGIPGDSAPLSPAEAPVPAPPA